MEPSWNSLPRDVLCHCFKILPFSDLPAVTRVCKSWRSVADSDALWCYLSQKDLRLTGKDPFLSWKSWYRLLSKKHGSFTNFHLLERKIVLVWGMYFSLDEIIYYLQGVRNGEVKLLKTGHEIPITCSRADLKRNQIRVITGSYDRTIRVCFKHYVKDDFQCRQILAEHKGMITALHCNDCYMFSGSTDKTVIVWKCNELHYTHHQTLAAHNGPITAIYVYKDPRFPHFFSASTDKTIIFWTKVKDSFQATQILEGHQAGVTRLTVSLNDNQLISGDEWGVVKIWGQRENKLWTCLHTIQAHEKPITSIRCQLYRGRFCTTGGNEVKLWKRSNALSDWEEAEKALVTDSPITELKMGHYIPENGSSELFVLTEKELQLAWLSEKGIFPSKKSIEFSN